MKRDKMNGGAEEPPSGHPRGVPNTGAQVRGARPASVATRRRTAAAGTPTARGYKRWKSKTNQNGLKAFCNATNQYWICLARSEIRKHKTSRKLQDKLHMEVASQGVDYSGEASCGTTSRKRNADVEVEGCYVNSYWQVRFVVKAVGHGEGIRVRAAASSDARACFAERCVLTPTMVSACKRRGVRASHRPRAQSHHTNRSLRRTEAWRTDNAQSLSSTPTQSDTTTAGRRMGKAPMPALGNTSPPAIAAAAADAGRPPETESETRIVERTTRCNSSGELRRENRGMRWNRATSR